MTHTTVKSLKALTMMLLLSNLLSPLSVAAKTDGVTFWLARHTEKANDDLKDPNLTEKGRAQAELLKARLLNEGIQAIYATHYKRTQQTAAPLAKALNIEVQAYDPQKLAELAEKLKQQGQTALVIGHSNTTPEMAWLLSDEFQTDIDEEEFNRILFKVQPGSKPKASTLHAINEVPDAHPSMSAPQIDSHKIHSFTSTFNMLFNQEHIGSAKQSVEVKDQIINMREETQVKTFNVDANITTTVKRSNFAPLTMTMEGKMGVPAAIDFTWQHTDNSQSLVTGFTDMARARYKQQGRIDFSGNDTQNTMERTAAIMLVPFFDHKQAFVFNWFNTYDATSRAIQMIPLGEARITVPAGTFETQKIKLQGGAPSQIFYVSKEAKPKVVKIEVLKMPWTYELQSWQAK